jgi:hypothetical protein
VDSETGEKITVSPWQIRKNTWTTTVRLLSF